MLLNNWLLVDRCWLIVNFSMRRFVYVFVLSCLCFGEIYSQNLNDKVLKVESKKVYFKSGQIFETNIFDIGFIGQIKSKTKKDFLILTGRQCQGCDANISIYIHSPSDGSLKNEALQERFGIPGKEFYYENNKLIYEGRAFWGEVLPGRTGIIWFQKSLNDKNVWIESVAFAELIDDQIKTQTINESLEKTLFQLKKGVAFEIEGHDVTSEP